MNLATKSILTCTAFVLMVSSAQAVTVNSTSVGTINGVGRTAFEATGNSMTQGAFATAVGTAFANDTGGVIDFEGSSFTLTNNDIFSVAYGISGTQTLNLTYNSSGNSGINTIAGEATSGTRVYALNSPGSAARTFTPDTPLLSVAIFNTDRNASGRNPQLIVTFQDNTTASTSGANANDWYFHALSGSVANPIVKFAIDQSDFVRYDDLGFIVVPSAAVPEPGSLALMGLGGLLIARRRRCA